MHFSFAPQTSEVRVNSATDKRMITPRFEKHIQVCTMATVTFIVPDDVNDAFNATFADVNKSAVIAALMSEAVERARRKQASDRAVDAILARQRRAPVYSASELLRSRMRNRP